LGAFIGTLKQLKNTNGFYFFFIRCQRAAARAVLGVLPDWIYQDPAVHLERGDKLVISTDGVTEAENGPREEFSEQRLLEAARAPDGSALDTQRAVCSTSGGTFRDDATLLVLRIE
jgi:phosphoserine phosphatase RsbU/P